MKNISLYFKSLLLILLFSNNVSAQLTYVPDDGFESFLIDQGLDSGPLDDYVLTSAIDTVTSLHIFEINGPGGYPIENILGIEDFNSLSRLIVDGTHNFDQITDLSNNINIDTLDIKNILTLNAYDSIIYPPNLKHLNLMYNSGVTNLDLSTCTKLISLFIGYNPWLNTINFNGCINLERFSLYEGNDIQYLDLSFCPLLNYLDFDYMSWAVLNLSYLNIKNGNNDNLFMSNDFDSWAQNPTICVDDVYSSFAQNLLVYNQYSINNFITLNDICATNKITGEVKYDINNDGCTTSNTYFTNYIINSTDGVNSFSSNQINNSHYSNYTFSGNYQTSVLNLPFYLTSNPLSKTTNFIGEHNIDTANFCISANQSINDVSVFITPLSTTSPGFNAFSSLVIKNTGTTTLSGDVTLTYDNNLLTFVSSSETVNSQTSNTLTFNYNNLLPFETRNIDITFDIAIIPTINIGDTLKFNAVITPIINDYNDTNNTFNINQVVTGSYDPNDISVIEGEEVFIANKNKFLHYFVRFQNTGNAPATNINIQNELDNKLDWNTLQIIESSHLLNLSMYNNRVDFKFNNINLPDSTSNESASHGYVYYKIKPKSNVVIGDSIYATANIYFDYNPAVVTNTVFTTFVENPLSIETFNSKTDITVFPIPTTSILNIVSTQKISKIEIYNQMGELVLSNNSQNSIDVSILNTGLYFCKIIDFNGQVVTKKIVKN